MSRGIVLNEVFTPSTVATLTYVQRKKLENDLIKNIQMPGMQIVMYGHSGSGKTTMLTNVLNRFCYQSIKTSCMNTTTFESLIFDILDKLDIHISSENTYSKEITSTFKLGINDIFSDFKIQDTDTSKCIMKNVRAVPLQISINRIADILCKLGIIWVIEDFHKIDESEKIKLSQVMKIFMDKAAEHGLIKIICIGAVGTARELIQYDKELNNRVFELNVSLMEDDELLEIIDKGFKLMRIKIEDETVYKKILFYSNNLPAVCHQLCYNMCYSKNIQKPSLFRKKILTVNDFDCAVKENIKSTSDTFVRLYEKIDESELTSILQTILSLEKESFKQKDIKVNYKKDVSTFLDMLCSVEYGEVLRYNSRENFYNFSNPFFQAFLKQKFAIEKLRREEKKKRDQKMELKQSTEIDYLEFLIKSYERRNKEWESIKIRNMKYFKL